MKVKIFSKMRIPAEEPLLSPDGKNGILSSEQWSRIGTGWNNLRGVKDLCFGVLDAVPAAFRRSGETSTRSFLHRDFFFNWQVSAADF
jgi:hypothetical protein